VLTPRQELLLRKVVEGYLETGQPIGSKAIASESDVEFGPSTIRNELAVLEEHGLLAHPHTSAGRIPTEAGYRYFVDRLLPTLAAAKPRRHALEVPVVRREVEEAMRVTTETLSQATNLLAIVSAPPLETATVRRIEVLGLQPDVVMVVIITSAGGVSKRVFAFDAPVDPGLVAWAGEYLNERLSGLGLGARMLHGRLADPSLSATERAFLERLAPIFTELTAGADDALYVEGAARLVRAQGLEDRSAVNDLVQMLERRVSLLAVLRSALAEPDVYVRIGRENETPALQSLALVAAGYGPARRKLGTVSVIGPVRMDYGTAIPAVREAAYELSRFIETVYEDT
jgi:heat-inducible transcriptional repressor